MSCKQIEIDTSEQNSKKITFRDVKSEDNVDIIQRLAILKWQWIGHVARADQNSWRPTETVRSVRRP